MSRRWIRSLGAVLPLTLVGVGAWAARVQSAAPAFDHAEHLPLFPGSCTTCHPGAAETGASLWPEAARCAACHDGVVLPRVEWTSPRDAPTSNLRFRHDRHRLSTADSVGCAQCHTRSDSARRIIFRQSAPCIGCHLPGQQHLSLSNDQCATCHVPLAEASGLTREVVSRFPVPEWHRTPGFGLEGHASLAPARGKDGDTTVAASCATCHARDFCAGCHVNAPEVAPIQALAPDDRSLAHGFTFAAPASHSAPNFVGAHGRPAIREPATCATCHTRPSCETCHLGTPLPGPVTVMHEPGPGRATGAVPTRRAPASHAVTGFGDGHGRQASAAPRSCATCHAQSDCLSCHRVEQSIRRTAGAYHAAGFLVRHPSAAYARQTTCGDCHNTQQFCVSCHAQAGLNARRALGASSFHDGRAGFFLGHGQAARQSLESCVSCHVERDCTACHSSVGRGFRFNPHGPGFDADRLRRRNPEMCIACHGRAIPGAP